MRVVARAVNLCSNHLLHGRSQALLPSSLIKGALSSPSKRPCPFFFLHLFPSSSSSPSFSSNLSFQPFCRVASTTQPSCCWSCGECPHRRECFLICPSCQALQPPRDSADHFQIFGVDPTYNIDLKDLEIRYKNLMRRLHPDLHHKKSEKKLRKGAWEFLAIEEQVNSAALSAIITTAYNELLRPVSRASYLLKLQGVHVEEEGTVNDPELLMEASFFHVCIPYGKVMEMREEFEEATDVETLKRLYNKANSRMKEWENSFMDTFSKGDREGAVFALQRMSYFGRLFDEIKRRLL